jgi:hypothetical protein
VILPVTLLAWIVLWLGNFSAIEDGIGLLAWVTLSFAVAAGACIRTAASSRVGSCRRFHGTTSRATRFSPQHRRRDGESVSPQFLFVGCKSRRNGRSRTSGSTG